MKLMIASDIHGAAGYCRALLDAFDREGADRLLLAGRKGGKELVRGGGGGLPKTSHVL